MKRPILWCRKVYNVHHCENCVLRLLPKAIFLKIMVAFFVFAFIGGYVSLNVLAQTEDRNSSSGMILHVDQKKSFVVIDLGSEDGLGKDCFFEVYRRDIKVGEIKTIKIRRGFSAADIECTYKNRFIKVGDRVRPSKKTAAVLEHKQMEFLREKLNEVFDQVQGYFKEGEYELAEVKIHEILGLDPENEKAMKMLSEIREALRPRVMGLEAEAIVVDINAPKHIILTTAIDMFRKYGCLITFSDPTKFNLQASKDMKPSLITQIATELGPYTRNKVYYTVEINELPKSEYLITNRLVIYLRKGFHKEGKFLYREIKKVSLIYKETREMAFAIKDVAEEL